MGQAFLCGGLRIALRDSRLLPGGNEIEPIRAITARTEYTEEAGVGRDQEGPPPFKFNRNEAMTDREAP